MKNLRTVAVAASLLLFGAAGCADLEVVNNNDPERERALSQPDDVVALIAGSYGQWFRTQQRVANNDGAPSLFLAAAAFEWSSTAANFGVLQFSRIPREPVPNSSTHQDYGHFADAWTRNYRAIAAVSEALRVFNENPALANRLSANDRLRARVFGKYVQGLAHASLALMYDRAYVVDERVAVVDESGAPILLGEPKPYREVMAAALAFFDSAIALAGTAPASVTIPTNWMATAAPTSMADMVRLSYSMKARFRASVARNETERVAVDWNALLVETARAVKTDFMTDELFVSNNWAFPAIYYPRDPTFGQSTLFIIGMADTSGMYQRWLSIPVANRENNLPDNTPVLIHTPDMRFPRGRTLALQIADTLGRRRAQRYYSANSGLAWNRPERGSWRWSYYHQTQLQPTSYATTWPLIRAAEVRLLAAEGLFRTGNLAAAADSINRSRWFSEIGTRRIKDPSRPANDTTTIQVPDTLFVGGLNPTNAAGLNTSCVPKLPNGSCGNLFEMLKWEKRMETYMTGPYLSTWYFDSRGWGDLYKGTPLQFPIPDEQLQVLGLGAPYSFGGVGGQSASPGSKYAWPSE